MQVRKGLRIGLALSIFRRIEKDSTYVAHIHKLSVFREAVGDSPRCSSLKEFFESRMMDIFSC